MARLTVIVAVAAIVSPVAAAGADSARAQQVGGPGDDGALTVAFDWFEEAGAPSPALVVSADDERRFRPTPAGGALGFRAHRVWLRCRLAHDAGAPVEKILELGFMPGVADLYRQEGARLVPVASSGTDRIFDERPVRDTRVAFRLRFAPGQDTTFWLGVRSHDALWARARLFSEDAHARRAALRNLGQGLYYGVLLAMILYNGVLYASTRERTFLLYTLFETAMLLLQASQDKVAFQYLWPRAPAWAERSEQLFGGLAMLGALAFTLRFLDLPKGLPSGARALRALAALAAGVTILAPLTTSRTYLCAADLIFMVSLAAIAAAGAIAAARGQANGRFFLVAWTPLLVGAFLALLSALGLVANDTAFLAFKLGSAAEATLLAVALANRIKLMRRERERADAALLAAKTAHAAALEGRVAARTRELSEALRGLRLTQDKLVRQERLTSLAGMVAGMAHEVGNPLNFAQGGADALGGDLLALERAVSSGQRGDAEETKRFASARRALSLVQSGLHRIGRIITNLNGYMQFRTLDTVPTDLVLEIESTLTIVDETLRRHGITVVKRFDTLPLFPCCPGELHQVFMNIVLNACGAMRGGGRLEITARNDPRAGIEIEFADDGPGIAPAHRDAIFEPFFSDRAIAGAGSGLGLYIAREIVSRHGGHLLLLDSARGARLAVRLPAAGLDAVASAAAP